jgi:hypothetical protein
VPNEVRAAIYASQKGCGAFRSSPYAHESRWREEMSKDQEIRELFKRHNVPLAKEDVWFVRGTSPVVRHQAVERLGAAIKVQWIDKQIIRAERDEAVILVSGHNGHGIEWSFGEALIGANYLVSGKQASYVYAMAEKRGKDRVILKLAGLHGVYSEEEADDFRQGAPEPQQSAPEKAPAKEAVIQQPEPKPAPKAAKEALPIAPSRKIYIESSLDRIATFDSAARLLEWAKTERLKVWPQYGIDPMDEDGQRIVRVYKDRIALLEQAGR